MFDCSICLLNALQNLTFLTSLCIHNVDNLPNKWLRGFRVLEKLDIGGSSLKSVSIQFDNLCALRELRFQCCHFETFPEGLGNLRSLRNLELSYYNNLVSLLADAFCSLSSFSKLTIQFCEKLSSLPNNWQHHLIALEDLFICACSKLTSLPDCIGHLTTLRRLYIRHCKGLTALPLEMGQLTSLSKLHIRDCPNLSCLPTGLQSLTMLSSLKIEGCPHLERQCKRGTGADWPNIAHIPNIVIRKGYLQTCSSPLGNLLARLGDYASWLNRYSRAHDPY